MCLNAPRGGNEKNCGLVRGDAGRVNEAQGLVAEHPSAWTLWRGFLAEAWGRAKRESEVDKERACDQEAKTGSPNPGLTPDVVGEVPFCAESGTLNRSLPPVSMSVRRHRVSLDIRSACLCLQQMLGFGFLAS